MKNAGTKGWNWEALTLKVLAAGMIALGLAGKGVGTL